MYGVNWDCTIQYIHRILMQLYIGDIPTAVKRDMRTIEAMLYLTKPPVSQCCNSGDTHDLHLTSPGLVTRSSDSKIAENLIQIPPLLFEQRHREWKGCKTPSDK